MKLRIYIALIVALFALSMQQHLDIIAFPKHFPEHNYSFENNPLSFQKIELGKMLFYDPILSLDSTISCASCHSPYNAFAHADHALSHGIHDTIGTRNAPALFNLSWNKSFMWDGAIHHLDVQPLAPISSPSEMNCDINTVVARLERSPLYKFKFSEAFDSEQITGENFLKALAQFQLSLISANSKYDQVLKGENTFTAQEAKGYALFVQHCNRCHTEPLFTNQNFETNQLTPDAALNDVGRSKISQKEEDNYKFKVPSLRNLDHSYPYMHDGRFKKLSQVLDHYSQANLTPKITLTSDDKKDLMSFLIALNDTSFIFNPTNKYPHNLYKIPNENE
ncbi:MAG: cytochrome-c peroxidase [Flavobacteriales bacterium]